MKRKVLVINDGEFPPAVNRSALVPVLGGRWPVVLSADGQPTREVDFFPAAVNDNGVIVGGNQIYEGGTLQNLNNLIPAGAPYQIDSANGINDSGQIVAVAYDTATNQDHTLLLNPN